MTKRVPIPISRFVKVAAGITEPHHLGTITAIATVASAWYVGWNSPKTSPAFKRKFQSGEVGYARHAELHAVGKIPDGIAGSRIKLYVVRFKKVDGSMSMAKPCLSCQKWLKERGLRARNIFYLDWEGEWQSLGTFEV